MHEKVSPDSVRTERLRSLQWARSAQPSGLGAPWTVRVLLLVAVLGALAALIWLWPIHESRPPVSPPAPESGSEAVPASAAAPQDAASAASGSARTVSGYLVARRQALVGVDVTARVAELLVAEGDSVSAGQVIARLAADTAQSDLAIARSRLAASEASAMVIAAQLKEAALMQARMRKLAPLGAASVASLHAAEAQHDALQAQARHALAQQATLDLEARRAQQVVDQHTVRAPFTGIVSACMVQAGEVVSPVSMLGGPAKVGICSIVDMASVEVEAQVPETWIARITPGMRAEVSVDAFPRQSVEARVRTVLPMANRERATVGVWLTPLALPEGAKPDMAVKVRLLDPASDASQDEPR